MIERPIEVLQLKRGMYVSRLDRPWTETDFMFQGVLVNGLGEIERIQSVCDYVYIDIERGLAAEHYLEPAQLRRLHGRVNFSNIEIVNKTPVEVELEAARTAYAKLGQEFTQLMESIQQDRPLNVEGVRKASIHMVDSILRNTDASLLLARLKKRDDYTYAHSVSCAAFATAFGRNLGLEQGELQDLALGVLLMDVGKMKMPRSLLVKPDPLTPNEQEVIRKHVNLGVNLLSADPSLTDRHREIVYCHHERHDGSGYPRQLQATEIPLYGRVAGLVDCYDAITSERCYSHARPHERALTDLYGHRDQAFQGALVEQFIQFMGVYPSGTVVELNSGEVGIVMAQNYTRRLRPRVMLVLDSEKQPTEAFPIVDLVQEESNHRGEPLNILRGLEPGSYGIEPGDYYL